MNKCHACENEIKQKDLKIYRGKQWHLKCLRKLRQKAKKKFVGNLDAAFKDLKEKRAFDER